MTGAGPASAAMVAGRRLLVTGASGFIGSHMVERFARDGWRVGALSRSAGRSAALAASGVCEFIACDLENEAQCREAVGRFLPEAVLHFASRPDGPETPEHARASISANLAATVNLLAACAPSVRVFVYGDSCKVYGANSPPYSESTPLAPNSSYGATKAAGWWMCRVFAENNSFAAVSFRPTLIYGPGQGMNLIEYVARRALSGAKEIALDGGSQTRDPLYIDDAVEAAVRLVDRAATLNGRAMTLGGGGETTVADLARLVVDLCCALATVNVCPERRKINRDLAKLVR